MILNDRLNTHFRRKTRIAIIIFYHIIIFSLAYTLGYAVRFDMIIPQSQWNTFGISLLMAVGVKSAVFMANRHHLDFWFYASMRSLVRLCQSAFIAMLLIYVVDYLLFGGQIPRSIPLIDYMFTILLFGGIQTFFRVSYDKSLLGRWNHKNTAQTPILLVGANHQGARFAHNIHSNEEMKYRVLGFLTRHREKIGGRLGDIPIMGHFDDICRICQLQEIREVVAIAGVLKGEELRNIMKNCKDSGLHLRIAPRGDAMLGGNSIPLRDISIDDLLQRDPVRLDDSIIRELIEGRRVMVTGAGGSIGSEICRQLIKFHPQELQLVGRGENRLFFLERELRQLDHTDIKPIVANITDQDRMNQVFEERRPEVVFHAAAHKHVSLMEANVSEAVRNNILGTKCVADLADEYDVKTFVLISTDKAVRPTNVMGASKHLAERYVCALSQTSSTRFLVTRFGNVLGSAGSVVPIFKEQIAQGGPVTVTDERMTRFFMTIPEASQLVLQAAAMGEGGEIFVLDMGKPLRIVDLARDMIRLAGLPEGSIEIHFSGIRPGEKLYEELYFDDEERLPTAHPKLFAAYHRPFSFTQVQTQIEILRELLNTSEDEIRHELQRCIPEYTPFQKLVPQNKDNEAKRPTVKEV